MNYEYIAGFFDGEGFITIQKRSIKSKSGSQYWLTASIANTHYEVLQQIQKITGGRLTFHKGDENKKHHYRLTFYSNDAYNFIKSIQEFTIVKRLQIDIAILFQESITKQHYHKGNPVPKSEMDFRNKCYIEIRNLHGNQIRVKENM